MSGESERKDRISTAKGDSPHPARCASRPLPHGGEVHSQGGRVTGGGSAFQELDQIVAVAHVGAEGSGAEFFGEGVGESVGGAGLAVDDEYRVGLFLAAAGGAHPFEKLGSIGVCG